MRGLQAMVVPKTARARELRRDGSRAEQVCWDLLRDRRIDGAKFRRQHPIGPFFADFACVSRKLVVEIDGDHHGDKVEADARRTAYMERLGWRVVRFGAIEVVTNPEGIWAEIEQAATASPTPSPNLSP